MRGHMSLKKDTLLPMVADAADLSMKPDRCNILSVAVDQLYIPLGILDLSNPVLFPGGTIELKLLN